MSMLAPLYFAIGALAIGLPILFHMIRRRPKGEVEFSSLMFSAANAAKVNATKPARKSTAAAVARPRVDPVGAGIRETVSAQRRAIR